MGYCVDMDIDLVVPSEMTDKCLEALTKLHTDENLKKYASGGCSSKKGPVSSYAWYSWVKNPENGHYPDLASAFENWRYEVEVNPNGDLKILCFNGEKWGNDELLFETIAPFVKSGSSIEVEGEDGCKWRHIFKNGKVKRQEGKVVYEE